MSNLPSPAPPTVPELPAATLTWTHAIAQAEDELCKLPELVAEIREFNRSAGW